MPDRIPVEELSFGVLDIKPINTDWNAEGEPESDDDRIRFWEAFKYDLGDREFTLIASGPSVIAMYTPDGLRVDTPCGDIDFDEHECENCDGSGSDENEDPCYECNATGNSLKLTVDDVTELQGVEPYEHGAEGPMMNYRYPLGDSEDSIGGYQNRCDAVEAAYRLRDTPLCIVEYEDDIALALTGGGMDLTWEIVEAFTLLGYMPPIHFCELPGMAGYPSNDEHHYIIAAVERALRENVEIAKRKHERHLERWATNKTV